MPMPFQWMGGSGNLDYWPLRPDGEPEEAAVADTSMTDDLPFYFEDKGIPYYIERTSYPLNGWQCCVPVSRLEEAKEIIRELKSNPTVFAEDIEELWSQFPPEE